MSGDRKERLNEGHGERGRDGKYGSERKRKEIGIIIVVIIGTWVEERQQRKDVV